MAKSHHRPQQAMDRIAHLRAGGTASADVRDELVKHLESKSNLVAAKAADALAALKIKDVVRPMEEAFCRFLDTDGSDKGCLAKTSIAKALHALEVGSETVFLRGVRHIQHEGTWGGSQDVAGELRAVSALGLAAMGYRHALPELADLLMDPDPQCRQAAARAIALVGHDSGALALRVKVLAGDDRVEIIEECFIAMATVDPARSVEFIGRFLNASDEDLRQAAAIALGTSRRKEAWDLLRQHWEGTIDPNVRRQLLPAIGLLRLPQSVDFLVDLVQSAHPSIAGEALKALAPYRHDGQVRVKVAKAVKHRDEPGITQRFEDSFAI